MKQLHSAALAGLSCDVVHTTIRAARPRSSPAPPGRDYSQAGSRFGMKHVRS